MNEDASFSEKRKLITISDPPKNNSHQTINEIEYLLKINKTVSDEHLIQIKKEISGKGQSYNGIGYLQIVNSKNHGIALSIRNLKILVLKYKYFFDRVRPSFLNNKIKPLVKVPKHAAYPSGHSSEAYFIANILTYIDPVNRGNYLNSAQSISKNREYAGIHYPSDTAAGKELADQYFQLMLNDETFIARLRLLKENLKL